MTMCRAVFAVVWPTPTCEVRLHGVGRCLEALVQYDGPAKDLGRLSKSEHTERWTGVSGVQWCGQVDVAVFSERSLVRSPRWPHETWGGLRGHEADNGDGDGDGSFAFYINTEMHRRHFFKHHGTIACSHLPFPQQLFFCQSCFSLLRCLLSYPSSDGRLRISH